MSKISGSNKGRSRNRNNGGKRPQGRGGNFDPNGGRSRGNAQQLMDKFLSLARDANSQGDRIAAENYFQHADHYYRVVHARNEQQEARRRNSNNGSGGRQGGDPIPVQPSGGEGGPVDLVTTSKQDSQTADVAADNQSDSSPTQAADNSDQPSAKVESAAPKKPRRGRPPKKTEPADKDSTTTEAAE